MSTFYLKELKPRLQTLWATLPLDKPFFSKLRKIVRFYREHCKHRAELRRREEEEAINDLHEAAKDLHDNPGEHLFRTAHSICQLHLKKLEAKKIAGRRIRSRTRWK